MMMLDRELNGGSRRHADVDYVAPDGLQRGVHDRLEHRTRNPAVATDDDSSAFSAGVLPRPGAEPGGEFRNDLRSEGFTHPASHAGHADHQSFVCHRHNVTLARRYIFEP